MIRNSVAGWTVGTLLCLAATIAMARQPSAAELYGRGVSAYFSGDLQQAIALLTKAIDANAQDPRAYFYRGLARVGQNETKAGAADFAKGAEIEATAQVHVYDVDDALQRIQGTVRIEIENARRAARAAAAERRRKQAQVRYEQLQRREKDVLFDPNRPAPKIDFAIPKVTVKVDPFASGLVLTGGKQVAVKTPAPAAAPAASGTRPRDPFAAPKTGGAAAKPADPFATGGSALPAPKAPAPKASDNPFGDMKPAPKTPAAGSAAPSSKPADNPFGVGPSKPAGAAGTPKKPAENPFGAAPAKQSGAAKKKDGNTGASASPPEKKPSSPPADDPFK